MAGRRRGGSSASPRIVRCALRSPWVTRTREPGAGGPARRASPSPRSCTRSVTASSCLAERSSTLSSAQVERVRVAVIAEGGATGFGIWYVIRLELRRLHELVFAQLQLYPIVVHVGHGVARDQETALVAGDLDEVHCGRALPDVELLYGTDLFAVLVENLLAPGVLPVLLEFTLEVVQPDDLRFVSHGIYPPLRRLLDPYSCVGGGLNATSPCK